MANTIKPNISELIPEQLPEFIQSDYPRFIAFLKAYYEFVEQQESAQIENARDLDYTLDTFVDKIRNELIYVGDNFQNIDRRFVAQRIKDLYLAKGSEESYRLLFRLLFNEEIDIKYPSSSIFKPSAGRWIQENSLFVTTVSGDAMDIVGKEVKIIIGSTIEKVIVSRIRTNEFAGLYEIFLEKPPTNTAVPGSIIEFEDFSGVVKESAGQVNIIGGGKGFRLGQIIDINTDLGEGTKLKVMGVTTGGVVTKLQILKFGFGYRTDFNVTVSPAQNIVTAFDPYEDTIESLTDFGVVIENDYFAEDDFGDFSYVGDVKSEFYNITDSASSSLDNEALFLNFVITGINKYPGYYEGNESFLSDTIYLQDSRFYQSFSYVLATDRQLDEYKDYVTQFIHPAGMKLFGEFSITNEINIKASVEFVLNRLIVSFADEVMIEDALGWNLDRSVSDSVSVSDIFSIEANFIITKYINDEVLAQDNGATYVKNFYTEIDYWDNTFSETDI